jgi:hypothetical protein
MGWPLDLGLTPAPTKPSATAPQPAVKQNQRPLKRDFKMWDKVPHERARETGTSTTQANTKTK